MEVNKMAKGEKVLDDLMYTETDEWVKKVGDNRYQIGISDYAQHHLKDIFTIDLAKVGEKLTQYKEWGNIESEKGVHGLCAPVSGKVVATNEDALGDVYDTEEPDPKTTRYGGDLFNINQKPYETWLLEVEISDESELEKLLKPKDYKKKIS